MTLYFIGSCTKRTADSPETEKTTSYTELTPDEYQKQMDELLKNSSATQTAFKSPILQAHASDFTDLIDKYCDYTPLYWLDDWLVGFNDIKNYFTKDNPAYPGKDSSEFEKPVESVKVPFQYEFYGKNRVVYKNGTYEIIECRLMTSEPVGTAKTKTGHIMYRRTNQLHSTTTFSFDISAREISKSFDSSSAFTLSFYGLTTNNSGIPSNFSASYLTGLHYARFQGSSTNSLKQFNINSDVSVRSYYLCYNSFGTSYPNVFSISSTVTNDYEFSQSVNNYYTNNKYWQFPNIYYNNNAGDIITQNNVSNYSEYGYSYNSITNSIEFDPDVLSNFFDADVIPKFKLAFDDIFSKFPDIDANFGDSEVNYTNIIEIMKEINNPDLPATTGTYPVSAGDVNVSVSVDVTFPPEFYKQYPALTTTPAFVAKNPNIDFALDAPLPVRALQVSGGFLTLASDFISDSGLMPIVLMCVALGFVTMLFF